MTDLVFVDREQSKTTFRTCVRRRGKQAVRTCFNATTGAAAAPTLTPLRFQGGRYVVVWSVAGEVVARWRFQVV